MHLCGFLRRVDAKEEADGDGEEKGDEDRAGGQLGGQS